MGDGFKRRFAVLLAAMIAALGAQSFLPSAAQAVAACPNNYVCTYQVYLAFAGSIETKWASTKTSCNKIYPHRTWSVKNETGYDYRVWHNSTCSSAAGGATSVFYAETDGNMNSDWVDDQVGSIQRLLN